MQSVNPQVESYVADRELGRQREWRTRKLKTMIKLHKCCSTSKSSDMRPKQVATTKSEKNVAFKAISTYMMSEVKTGGVNNLPGRNANRHEDKSGTLCTKTYTLFSSQRMQDSTCGNKGIELSAAH